VLPTVLADLRVQLPQPDPMQVHHLWIGGLQILEERLSMALYLDH
jgi:hypothetical protein